MTSCTFDVRRGASAACSMRGAGETPARGSSRLCGEERKNAYIMCHVGDGDVRSDRGVILRLGVVPVKRGVRMSVKQ